LKAPTDTTTTTVNRRDVDGDGDLSGVESSPAA